MSRAAGARGRFWVLAPLIAPCVVFWEALVGRRVIAPGDGISYYLPLQMQTAGQWRDGIVPAWDAGSFSGSPLLGIHQGGSFSPWTLPALALPPVPAYNLTIVLAIALAGAGAFALTWRVTGDGVGAAVAGCSFGLGGFWFSHLAHLSILTTTAFLPWMVWAADRVVTRRRVSDVAWGAVIVALGVVSGHGQMLIASVAAAILYGLIVMVRPGRLRAVGALVAMVGCGALLGSVQLLPVLATVQSSTRTRLSFGEATAWSHDDTSILGLLFPHLYGNTAGRGPVATAYTGPWTLTELGGYLGAAACALAVVGLLARGRDRRTVALLVIAGVGLLAALGGATPAGRIVHALPVVGATRSWARYAILVQLAVSVLAGCGVAAVRSGRRSLAWRDTLVVVGVLGLPALVAVTWTAGGRRVEGWSLTWAVGAPMVAAGLGFVALVLVARRTSNGLHRLAAVVLVGVVCMDAVVGFGWWSPWRTASPTPREAAALIDGTGPHPWGPVPDEQGGIDRYLWADDPLSALPHGPRWAAPTGMSSVTGMDPLAPADYLDVTGTDYWGNLTEPDHLLGADSLLPDLLRVTVIARRGPSGVERDVRRPGLPEAFVVGSARQVLRPEAIDVATGRRALVAAAEAVYEGSCSTCPRSQRRPVEPTASAGPVVRAPGRLDVAVVTEGAGLLIVSEAWAPGWGAEVDGRPATVVRADGVVIGVPVPAGSSKVTLRYEAPGLRTGAVVTGVMALLLGAILVGGGIRRRRSTPAVEPAAGVERCRIQRHGEPERGQPDGAGDQRHCAEGREPVRQPHMSDHDED